MKQQFRKLRAFYYKIINNNPSKDMVLIGVTGTDGKSTTCEIIFQILKASGKSVGLISTIGGKINDEVFDTGLHTSTPSSKQIYVALSLMQKKGVTHCIIELTSHGLFQHRAFGLLLDGCIYTNITHEHLDEHKTFEHYREAKASMMDLLRENGIVSINKNDQNESYLTKYANSLAKKLQIIYYGIDDPLLRDSYPKFNQNENEKIYTAREIKHLNPYGYSFLLCMANLKYQSNLPLDGLYNLQNTLGAISLCIQMQFPLGGIIEGVKNVKNIKGRMNILQEIPFRVIVDFAHTPNAFSQLLSFLKSESKGRLIVLFGCPSQRDDSKRALMGKEAAAFADIIILTSEDPREESINEINRQIMQGISTEKFQENKNLILIDDREKAIQKALQMAQPNDTIALLGKGHEGSNCIGKEEILWDEEKITRKYLN